MLRALVPALLLAATGSVQAPAATPPPAGKPAHVTIAGAAVIDTAARRLGKANVYLAWHAPWGTPGARDTATWACNDTLAADTLYLTFDPGQDVAVLMGIDVTLLFHSAPGDTLGPFWDLSRKGANPYNLRIEFSPAPEGAADAWPVLGEGGPRYQVKGETGKLDLLYYVPASKGGPIFAGARYFAARVIVRARKPQLGGCHQPVCVDLDHIWVSHTDGSIWINSGQRFTSLNSPGGAGCREWRKRPPTEEPMRFGGRYDLKAAPGETTPTVRDTTHR